MCDRHTRFADLARGDLRVGVIAILSRKIESNGKSALALFEIASKALIGLSRIAESSVRSDNPGVAPRLAAAARICGLGHLLPPASNQRNRESERNRVSRVTLAIFRRCDG